MIAVDTNILVYAHRAELRKHASARRALIELAEGTARWVIAVFCFGEFLRITSHPRLFDPPFTSEEACGALERLLESPSLAILMPGPLYPELLLEALREGHVAGNLVFDAQIVALCREAGVKSLLTEDRDFDRFTGFSTMRLG